MARILPLTVLLFIAILCKGIAKAPTQPAANPKVMELKDWLGTRASKMLQHERRIGLVGVRPHKLKSPTVEAVVIQGGGQVGDDGDDRLVRQLLETFPQARLYIASLDANSDADRKSMPAALVEAAKRRCEFVYIDAALFAQVDDRRDSLDSAVKDCWAGGCLPVTIVDAGQAPPPGVLSFVVGRNKRTLKPWESKTQDRLARLHLDDGLLEPRPKELDELRAAAVWILTMLAALETPTQWAHLERTAICYGAADFFHDPDIVSLAIPYLSLPKALAAKQAGIVCFAGGRYDFLQNMDAVDDLWKSGDDPPPVPLGNLINVSVRADAPIRLAAASWQLVGADPSLHVPLKPPLVTVVMRSNDPSRGPAAVTLLQTLCTPEPGRNALFTSVSAETRLLEIPAVPLR